MAHRLRAGLSDPRPGGELGQMEQGKAVRKENFISILRKYYKHRRETLSADSAGTDQGIYR